MVIDLKVDSGKIKNNLNVYLLYFLIISAISVLLIISGSGVYANISQKRKDIGNLESEVSKLNTKIDALKSVNKEEYADISLLSLTFPQEDPSLFAYSQLKELALRNAVFIYDLIFVSPSAYSEVISKSGLTFNVSGTRDRVIGFLSDLLTDAPLIGFENIYFKKYPNLGEIFTVSVSVDYYFSSYPQMITSIEGSVIPLSENEKESYESLKNLKILSMYDITPQDPNTEMVNPFVEMAAEVTPTVTPVLTPMVTPSSTPVVNTQVTPEVTPVVTPGEIGE